jgi:drug/metabolite transporter (DMT)-like permease
VGKSVLGGCAFLLVMMALERNDISSALPMMGLTPALVAVLATFALDQPLRGPEWGGLLLMLAGCALLEARSGQALAHAWGAAFRAGRHRYIVGAIVLFAVSAVADKMLVSGMRVPPFVVMFHQHVVYCLLFGVLLLARRASAATLAARARENWPLLVTIAVFTIGYRWFQLEATKLGPVALVLATQRTSIVYASLFGGRIFAEERLAMRVLGGVLIVAAGFLFLGASSAAHSTSTGSTSAITRTRSLRPGSSAHAIAAPAAARTLAASLPLSSRCQRCWLRSRDNACGAGPSTVTPYSSATASARSARALLAFSTSTSSGPETSSATMRVNGG